MQRHLYEIGKWAAKWRINISAKKTKAVVLSKKTRLLLPELKLKYDKIDYIARVCYLGAIFDRRLNGIKLYEALRHKALKSLAPMKPLLRSSLSLKAKLHMFGYYIRHVMA